MEFKPRPHGSPKKFTQKLREELLQLKDRLENEEELASFPWERYHALAERDLLSRLPASYPNIADTRESLHELLAKELKVFRAISSAASITPITEVDAEGHAALLKSLGQEKTSLRTLFALLDTHVTFLKKNVLFMPPNVPQELLHVRINTQIPPELKRIVSASIATSNGSSKPSAQRSPLGAKQAVGLTLESLCNGKDDKQRSENAAKIDRMWAHVKSKTREENYPVAFAAVYKLAEWLGIAQKEIKGREWKAVIQQQYNIAITETLSKYTIAKGNTKPFRQFVLTGFDFAQVNMPLVAKRRPLPDIYQPIPADTKTRKSGG